MKIHGQAVVIPKFGKLPNLIGCQGFSVFEIVSFAPFVNPFFRLEEKHRRSGKDQVVIPAGKGQREVDEQLTVCNLAIPNFQLNRLIALRADRLNNCVTVEGGRDAEHVPGAVGKIGFPIRMDFEIRGNPREWICHADGQGLWFQKKRMAIV